MILANTVYNFLLMGKNYPKKLISLNTCVDFKILI